jgi:glycosyltransferase involved in cell wall biosynthesis
MPKLSIVLPVYNVEAYVEECLLSIKNQSFEDFEVIVVNDGSTDSSLSVVEKTISGDSRFKIISQVNRGLSVARNTGVGNASGEYLTFLDSDDKISDGALLKLSKLCLNNDLDMIAYGTSVFYENGVVTTQEFNYDRPTSLLGHINTGRNFFKISIDEQKYRPSACMYWIKSSLARKYEFFPGVAHEDNLYTTQALLDNECRGVRLVKDAIYLRRVREGSIMMSKPGVKNYTGYLVAYKILGNTLNDLDEGTEGALSKYRAALFVRFVSSLVGVHGLSIPLKMRLEIFKCWRHAHGALMSPKYVALTVFPFTVVAIKEAVKYFRGNVN